MKAVSQLARQKAAQAWCQPETSHIPMDEKLAEAFAKILEEVWTQAWLSNATTGQLLDEIRARVDCNYKINTEGIIPPVDLSACGDARYQTRDGPR